MCLDTDVLLWDEKQILPPPISKSDFDKVLAKQRPTVSKDDLIIQDKFTKEFGEEG